MLAPIANEATEAKDVVMRGLRLAAIGVALATVAIVAYGWLEVLGPLREPTDDIATWILPFITVAILTPLCVGLLIALRRPRNPIAWILLIGALVVSLEPVDDFLRDGWALQTARATWPLLYAWPIAITYVFPNGRLLSPRWRWAAGAGVASFIGVMAIAMLDPSAFEEPDADVPNPLAGNALGDALIGSGIWIPFLLGILGSLFAGVLAIRLRLRRSEGVERLQTLWLAWSASLIPLALLLCAASWVLFDWVWVVVFPLILVTQAVIALSIAIAVARYRLYAIERVVNRTLVYATLTYLLIGTYVAVSLVLGVLLGRGSAWVTAGATLTVALGFRPLRALIQEGVDRRFSRARYEARRRVRDFEQAVREGEAEPEGIAEVVAEALEDPTAELLFVLPASERYADAEGGLVELDGSRPTAPIVLQGNEIGVLLHDESARHRPELLRTVLGASALTVEIARLRLELRVQLDEVERSRERIVRAGYEERRRLERDLHDGAQQRLVTLGMALRRAERSLPNEARVLRPALSQAVDEIGRAVADIRRIAMGLRPPMLDQGLTAALEELSRNAAVPVEIDVDDVRLPPVVEAAAFFVASEAVTNAVKHASPTLVQVRARRENGTLTMVVDDDGVGGARIGLGSGLQGLVDRVSAHGGRLRLESPRGKGTHVEVVLPCE